MREARSLIRATTTSTFIDEAGPVDELRAQYWRLRMARAHPVAQGAMEITIALR